MRLFWCILKPKSLKTTDGDTVVDVYLVPGNFFSSSTRGICRATQLYYSSMCNFISVIVMTWHEYLNIIDLNLYI